MAKKIFGDLLIATANRLVDGVVVFLDDAGGWTQRLERAALARDKRGGEILLERTKAEAFTVVDPYLVAVSEAQDGRLKPLSLRKRSAPRAHLRCHCSRRGALCLTPISIATTSSTPARRRARRQFRDQVRAASRAS